MKNSFSQFISRLDKAKKRISEFEDRSIEVFQTETQREKRMKNKQYPRLSDNFKMYKLAQLAYHEMKREGL